MLALDLRIERVMRHTTGFALSWAAIPLSLSPLCAARAAQEDTQLWTTAAVTIPMTDELQTGLEISPRFRSDAAGGYETLGRIVVDDKLSQAVTLSAGAAYLDYSSGHEFRPQQQMLLTRGALSFRTRVEERFFSGADRMEVRLRERVQASFALPAAMTFSVAGEVLGIVRSRNRGGDARLDQWRAQVSVRRKLSKRVDLTAGYLFIYAPIEGRADKISHVPQLSLTARI